MESLTTSIRSLSSEMSDVGDNLLISQTQEPPTTEDTLINFESSDIIFQSTITEPDNFTPTSTLLQDEQDKPATLFEFNPTPPIDAT
ncbi:hypothetical protein, partial [Salmonella sp. s54836]|uniref:hypothetical protein n=1 Tax=Salmonella sp. s54836 TaxID=3159673 RepID=UPI00397EB4D6